LFFFVAFAFFAKTVRKVQKSKVPEARAPGFFRQRIVRKSPGWKFAASSSLHRRFITAWLRVKQNTQAA
jgi:hypothetical protein